MICSRLWAFCPIGVHQDWWFVCEIVSSCCRILACVCSPLAAASDEEVRLNWSWQNVEEKKFRESHFLHNSGELPITDMLVFFSGWWQQRLVSARWKNKPWMLLWCTFSAPRSAAQRCGCYGDGLLFTCFQMRVIIHRYAQVWEELGVVFCRGVKRCF